MPAFTAGRMEVTVFDFGRANAVKQAVSIASSVLETIYQEHFGRAQPVNLAAVIIRTSFNPTKAKFGGRIIGRSGPVTHAADGLRHGYGPLDINVEAKAACAAALEALLIRAADQEVQDRIEEFDRGYLRLIASSLSTDDSWQKAMAHLPVKARQTSGAR